MKKYFVLLIVTFLSCSAGSATISPLTNISSAYTNPVNPMQQFSTLSMKEVQKLAGRKLKLKEKIAVKVFQWKIKRGLTQPKPAENKDNGKTSFILGLIGLAGLVVPGIGLLSLPLAIIAIAVGNKAKKLNPDDKKARTGVTFGWITIGILVTVLAIVLLVIAIPIGPF
jgi:hypothetical protein